jgi:ABC-type sugar transport system ATPase subunit
MLVFSALARTRFWRCSARTAPDAGHMRRNGKPYDPRKDPSIASIHQDLGQIDWMTVAENIAMARASASSSPATCSSTPRGWSTATTTTAASTS